MIKKVHTNNMDITFFVFSAPKIESQNFRLTIGGYLKRNWRFMIRSSNVNISKSKG